MRSLLEDAWLGSCTWMEYTGSSYLLVLLVSAHGLNFFAHLVELVRSRGEIATYADKASRSWGRGRSAVAGTFKGS